jgi:uracil-DNA glycosylase
MGEAHVATLEPVRAGLLAQGRRVPLFDPEGGGADARLLLLMETPGPARGGPRFVSQDNATPTGRNLRRFLVEAGIERRDLLIWNVVPWIVHPPGARNRAVTAAERREGMALLPELLARLSDLRAVVLAGRHAAAAEGVVRGSRPDAAVLTMPHPSPVICCTDPAYPARIAAVLAEAAGMLG